MEACEELIRVAKEANIHDPFKLVMDFKGDAVVTELHYNGHIPLNPHKTEDYELPDSKENLDDVDLDNLWLYLIKKRMDRVLFSIQGQSHILSMIKYQRTVGREKQLWVMAITPKLKKGLILHLDDPQAESPSSVLQAVGSGALKLGPSETFFIRNIDGKKSFHDLYMEHIDVLGMVSPNTLCELYKMLESNKMLADKEDKTESRRLKHFFTKILHLDISIPNSDAIVTAIHKYTKFCYTPLGLCLLLLTGLSGAYPLWENISRFETVIIGLEATLFAHPTMIIPLYIMTLIHIMLHELGHGVTCKHYGGNVPRLGIMFYLSSFIFYCDTTSSWNFPKKWSRILVSLGGPIVSFSILGIGLWGAAYSTVGSIWESIMVLFCLGTILGLIMNFNPFIKMDAYYMLLDVTGIANLRKKSFAFLENKILGRLGWGSEQIAATRPGEERVFWWYGILGVIFTAVFIFLPLLRIGHILVSESASGGRFLLICLLIVLVVFRLTVLTFNKYKAMRNRNYSLQ